MEALKYSRQGESIRACLMNRHDHPTTDTPCTSIREEFPNAGLGAVYCNLDLLAETSGVQRLACRNGTVHFSENIRQHYHFMHSKCNQAYDMELGAMKGLNKEAQEYAPDIIDSHYVPSYGRYSSYLQKKVDKAIDKPA